MNIVLNLNSLSYNNIFLNDSIKNTVINDSNFIKITYSNVDFILNGIYININIYKNYNNKNIIESVNNLEKYILNIYNNHKIHSYKLKDQLNYLINKLNNSNKNQFNYILKISGIWETISVIGLTYKFIFV